MEKLLSNHRELHMICCYITDCFGASGSALKNKSTSVKILNQLPVVFMSPIFQHSYCKKEKEYRLNITVQQYYLSLESALGILLIVYFGSIVNIFCILQICNSLCNTFRRPSLLFPEAKEAVFNQWPVMLPQQSMTLQWVQLMAAVFLGYRRRNKFVNLISLCSH